MEVCFFVSLEILPCSSLLSCIDILVLFSYAMKDTVRFVALFTKRIVGLCVVLGLKCRTKFRQQMNRSDNLASSAAVDSLLNYETVKVKNSTVFFSPFVRNPLYDSLTWSVSSLHIPTYPITMHELVAE